MATISNEATAAAYAAARSVFERKLTRTQAVHDLHATYGLNKNSAADFLQNFDCMLKGKRYTRTNSTYATDLFLRRIAQDYGAQALTSALAAVKAHIEYYEQQTGSRLAAIRKVHDRYSGAMVAAIDSFIIDQTWQEDLAASARSTAVERRKRLAQAPPKARQVFVRTAMFLRNPDVVVEVLDRAEGKCEGCGKPAPFSRRSDGTPYLEVHHRVRLVDGGDDTVSNALALCPNCHRQQHFG